MSDPYRFRVACPAQHSYVAMVRPDPLIYALWLRDHASCEAVTGGCGDETVRPTQAHPGGTVGGSESPQMALSGTSVHSGTTHTTVRGDK